MGTTIGNSGSDEFVNWPDDRSAPEDSVRRGVEVIDYPLGAVDEGDEKVSGLSGGIERVMAALPSSTWLVLAGTTLVGSFALRLARRPTAASFVGQWTPVLLICSLYNKLTTVGAATALLSSSRR